jgi:CheY-like chemotaxis protein
MEEEGEINILLVDDEEEFANTLAARLRGRSYRVELAFDGRQALELIAQRSFEVILLDMNMPGLHGLEVLRRMSGLVHGEDPLFRFSKVVIVLNQRIDA